MTLRDRLYAKTEPGPIPARTPHLGPCLIFTGAKRGGYGRIRVNRERVDDAHRAAWELENGPIPAGLEAEHRCGVKACIELTHLRLATRKQNNENRATYGTNKSSKHRGVTWNKKAKRWHVQVMHNRHNYYGGQYDDEDEAGRVAADMRRKFFTHNDIDRIDPQE